MAEYGSSYTRDDSGSHFLTRDPRDPLRFVDPLDP